MQPTTKEFLEKLVALLEEYQVEITIEESCSGYGGFTVDGIDLDIPYTLDGYKRNEYLSLYGKWFTFEDFKEKLNGPN
jgi:hypothetical protein